jgi:hypothetical protein
MKKITILLAIAFLSSFTSFAQISEGKFTYSNNELSLTFTTIDGGWGLSDIVITYKNTGKTATGVGEWFKVNMNGADPDYSGPEGWYQFETTECYFEFNTPSDTLLLMEGCKNMADKKYELKLQN